MNDEIVKDITTMMNSLNERIMKIETLLAGEDSEPEHSQWSYKDLRSMLDHTDFAPDMSEQALYNLRDDAFERINGIQTKIDKIVKLLEKFKIEMSVKDALNL